MTKQSVHWMFPVSYTHLEYTKGLLRSIPNVDRIGEKLIPIPGTPINLLNLSLIHISLTDGYGKSVHRQTDSQKE